MPTSEFMLERRSASLEQLSSYGRRRLRLGFRGPKGQFVSLTDVAEEIMPLLHVLAYRSAQLEAESRREITSRDVAEQMQALGLAAFEVSSIRLPAQSGAYAIQKWLTTGRLPPADSPSRRPLEIADVADRSATRLLLSCRTAEARLALGDQLNIPVAMVGPRISDPPSVVTSIRSGERKGQLLKSATDIEDSVRHLTTRDWFLPTGPCKRIAGVVATEAQSWLTTADHMSVDRAAGLLSAIDWLVALAVERLVLLDDLLQAVAAADLDRLVEHLDTYVIAAWSSPMVAATHIATKCPLGPAADAAEELAADALSLLDLIRFTGYQWATVASPSHDVIDELRAQIAAAQWFDQPDHKIA